MRIFNVLGFGLFLVILFLFMPVVFAELVQTFIVFLQSAQQALAAAGIIASYAGHIPAVSVR